MRVALLSICLALSACASPGWVNAKNPGADLQADLSACDRDVERVARLRQLGDPAATRTSCMEGPFCAKLAENQRIQIEAEAFGARKRCMANRGWRQ